MSMDVSVLFNDTASADIYTLSQHDALPIFLLISGQRTTTLWDHTPSAGSSHLSMAYGVVPAGATSMRHSHPDRKSTRLNSSHANISYAVFCLTKKRFALTKRCIRCLNLRRL